MQNKKNTTEGRRKFIYQTAALASFTIVPSYVLALNEKAPNNRINLGFIGAGRQALNLQKSFLQTQEIQIVAVSDVYRSKMQHFIFELDAWHTTNQSNFKQDCVAHEDFMELLDRKDIDGVVIASPDHWHASMAVRAAEAGKDIYCEKPLSLTISEGCAMVNATRKNKRIFQTGSMQRSWPEFRQTVELIKNGYIGDIQSIKVNVGGSPKPYDLPQETIPYDLNWDLWLGPNEFVHYNHQLNPAIGDDLWAQWRYYKGLGGGDMTDWGTHMFDIVQWALDKDDSGPIEIIPPDGSNYPHLTFNYGDGIVVTREDFGKNHAIQFKGTEGSIEVQRHKLVTFPESLSTESIKENENKVYYSDNHYKDFLDAMRSRKKPIADVETGHRSATICNLGNIACELRRPLYWNPKKEKFKRDSEANKLRSRKMKPEWSV
ncbi:Inositol 2-dehydrogenase/D-chiro-inositol 3-dehydrogenase [Arenibacter antarcticus]|uniref:Gfo/Idh/MocA family protein n=1 Tax=Arenibacter antarcticus TaxID=2040469 RepID=A0ABW5VG80_9FLAO|nr:Gfo/Idh/MocA family oxidoreductase [Arenibacter sp. H213]MCM4168383.1 oxidoreductase [Arenibacter sp. H213]